MDSNNTAIEIADSTEKPGQTNGNAGVISEDEIEKMIQSATDKVRTDYVKKLKSLESEKEELKKSAMSEAEKAKYEKEQHEKSLQEKEKELTRKELLIEATDLLKAENLDISFRKYVVGNDIEETKKNIIEFKSFIDSKVKEELDKINKGLGRDVKTSSGSSSEMLRSDFDKLSPKERAAIMNDKKIKIKED